MDNLKKALDRIEERKLAREAVIGAELDAQTTIRAIERLLESAMRGQAGKSPKQYLQLVSEAISLYTDKPSIIPAGWAWEIPQANPRTERKLSKSVLQVLSFLTEQQIETLEREWTESGLSTISFIEEKTKHKLFNIALNDEALNKTYTLLYGNGQAALVLLGNVIMGADRLFIDGTYSHSTIMRRF